MYFKIFQNIVKVLLVSSVVIFSAEGVYLLSVKPDVPFKSVFSDNNIVVTSDYSDEIKKGSIVRSIDGIEIESDGFLETYLDTKSVGDEVSLLIDGKVQKLVLINAYPDDGFIIISIVVAGSLFLFSLFIIFRKPDDVRGIVLFVMFNLFALAVCTSPGKIPGDEFVLALSVRTVHTFSYLFGVALLIHFAFVFPSTSMKKKNILLAAVYLFFAVFCILMVKAQYEMMLNVTNKTASAYHNAWNILLTVLMLSIIIAGVLFFKSYFSSSLEDKKRIQWVLFGMIFGVMPYLVLFTVPSLLNIQPVIKEEYAFGFMFLIPLTFTIGIIRHHLFDIEILFRRSLVYSLLTFAIFGIYTLLVFFLSRIFVNLIGDSQVFFSLIAAVLISVFINPLRLLIQKYVNKIFYREKYDFNTSVNNFISKVIDYPSISELSSGVLTELNHIIPSEWSGFIVRSESGVNLKLAHSINARSDMGEIFPLLAEELKKIHFFDFLTEDDKEIEFSDIYALMKKMKLSLIVPLKLERNIIIIGYLLFGKKLSGMKFSDSDLMLINTVSSTITLALNKLNIQEILLLREIEKDKLETLNKLKSDFVSNVSHELKTPLTSIQMFVDTMIDRPELPREKKEEYLRIISGEGERLNRLINSLLDFSRFETGAKKYNFQDIKVTDILNYVLNTFEYQFKKTSASISKKFSPGLPYIKGDPDAIAEVFINLLSNSLKYSVVNPVIEISMYQENSSLIVEFTDNGIGIPAEFREKIFDKFFRIQQRDSHTGGTGIGLTVVKSIMDAHDAVILVESEDGRGTTFKLIFKI